MVAVVEDAVEHGKCFVKVLQHQLFFGASCPNFHQKRGTVVRQYDRCRPYQQPVVKLQWDAGEHRSLPLIYSPGCLHSNVLKTRVKGNAENACNRDKKPTYCSVNQWTADKQISWFNRCFRLACYNAPSSQPQTIMNVQFTSPTSDFPLYPLSTTCAHGGIMASNILSDTTNHQSFWTALEASSTMRHWLHSRPYYNKKLITR